VLPLQTTQAMFLLSNAYCERAEKEALGSYGITRIHLCIGCSTYLDNMKFWPNKAVAANREVTSVNGYHFCQRTLIPLSV